MKEKKSKTKVTRLPQIDYECKVGERVFWLNIKKERFEGVIKEWIETTAVVKLDDGSEVSVKC